jgi:hypothetical protein
MQVIQLTEKHGMLYAGDTLLILRGCEDVDVCTLRSPWEKIISALYDAHQVQDPPWPDGTTFWLRGRMVAQVSGVHVIGG